MLLSAPSLANVYNSQDMYLGAMSVSVDIPLLGYEEEEASIPE